MTKAERDELKRKLIANMNQQIDILHESAYKTGSLDASPGYRGKAEAAAEARATMEEAVRALKKSIEEVVELVPA